MLRRLQRARGLLVLLGLGGIAGALLARHAPGAVIQWGFVAYLVVTIVDVLLRPGFVRPKTPDTIHPHQQFAIPTPLGLSIGTTAAFLGVGGSVMTVPLLRRAGQGMDVATTLANPLTLAISLPAALTFLAADGPGSTSRTALVGSVDVAAALALLLGALPVIIILRRRPPRLPDRVHALSYVLLLIAVTFTTSAAALR